MKAKIMDERADVYARADSSSEVVGELVKGLEVITGKTVKGGGTRWITVTLPNGTTGYAHDKVKVYIIREVILAQDKVEIFDAPGSGSNVKKTCSQGTRVTLAGLVSREGKDWVEVRNGSDAVGFMLAETRIKEISVMFKKEDYRSFMLGMFLIGGLIVIPITYARSNIGFFESIPWAILSCIVFLVGFKRNGEFSMVRAVPAIIGAAILAMKYNISTGQPAFISGGMFGYMLLFVCGYVGIGIDRLLKWKKERESA